MRSWIFIGFALGCVACSTLRASDAADAVSTGAAPKDGLSAQLRENVQIARWMLVYDQVASDTTDLLLKENKETIRRVTPVWFCMEKDHVWYAVYGGYQPDAFDIAICYKQVSMHKFKSVVPPEFPDKDRFARALDLTLPVILDTTRRTTVRFNYYVRAVKDRIEVYYVPAIQPDGKMAYGIQHTFTLSANGGELISHKQYGKVLIGALPSKQRTVTLEMTQCAVPTPQAIFAMACYRVQFADIVTHCQDGYFGVATNDGVLTCVRTSAPPAEPSMMPAGLGGIPAVGQKRQ
jgi:hypothetical protein